MSSILLNSIEWHDLPVSQLCITDAGVSLVVTPYNEATASYDGRVLRITNAESLSINVTGVLSPKDFGSLEVSTFTYSVGTSGRITGTVGLLPGNAGFWELSFTNALWELAEA